MTFANKNGTNAFRASSDDYVQRCQRRKEKRIRRICPSRLLRPMFLFKFGNRTILLTLVFLVFLTRPVFASSTDGTIDSTYKFAWSENVGWLNFGTSYGNVHVTDSGLSGYALSENVGWINLDNVVNDGQGNLSGYAWGENVGWIKFNPTNGEVTINSSGEFSGSALGENIGWVIFDCSTSACVKTDWRPQSARPQCNNSSDDDSDGLTDYPQDSGCDSLTDTDEASAGGAALPPVVFNPPTPPSPTEENPQGGFRIVINDNAEATNSQTVSLGLYAGSDSKRMAISNYSDFRQASQETYKATKPWTLTEGDGMKTVYAKFFTEYGQPSEVVSDTIYLSLQTQKPISEMTVPELKAKISELLSLISSLKNQLDQLKPQENQAQKEVTEIPKDYLFSENLKYGDRNIHVRYLQIFLKSQGQDIYPERIISGWFGPLTKKAVIRFQEKYAFDILAPWGFQKGTGIVGKTTRAKINEMMKEGKE